MHLSGQFILFILVYNIKAAMLAVKSASSEIYSVNSKSLVLLSVYISNLKVAVLVKNFDVSNFNIATSDELTSCVPGSIGVFGGRTSSTLQRCCS